MSVPQNKADFKKLFQMGSKRDLRKVAKENGIKNYSTLNKEELVDKLIAEMGEVRQRKEARFNKQKALTEVAKKLQTKYPNAKVFYKRNVLNFTTIGPPIGNAGSFNRKTYNDENDVEANIAQSYGQFIRAVMDDGEDILKGKAVALDNKKKLELAFKGFKAMRAKALGKREAETKATTFAETKAKQKGLSAIRQEMKARREEKKPLPKEIVQDIFERASATLPPDDETFEMPNSTSDLFKSVNKPLPKGYTEKDDEIKLSEIVNPFVSRNVSIIDLILSTVPIGVGPSIKFAIKSLQNMKQSKNKIVQNAYRGLNKVTVDIMYARSSRNNLVRITKDSLKKAIEEIKEYQEDDLLFYYQDDEEEQEDVIEAINDTEYFRESDFGPATESFVVRFLEFIQDKYDNDDPTFTTTRLVGGKVISGQPMLSATFLQRFPTKAEQQMKKNAEMFGFSEGYDDYLERIEKEIQEQKKIREAETKAKQKEASSKSKFVVKADPDDDDDEDIELEQKQFEGTTWLVDPATGHVYGATHLKPPVKTKPIGKLSVKKQFKSWLMLPATIEPFNNPPQSIIDYYDDQDADFE
jgi:hypothetical protein